MSSKKKKDPKKEIKNDKKISSVIEIKERDNKIVYVLFLIIAILISLLVFFAFFNKSKTKNDCSKCNSETIEIEVEPNYQLINYGGFRFKMPLNWDFVSEDTEYKISDLESKLFISFEEIKEDYELFSSTDYQLNFLEKIQTSDNIKLDQSKTKKENNYYLYEGKYNDYNYLMIAIGNSKKTILVKTQFIDKISFDKEKNNIIDFVLSSINKSEE